MKALRLPLHVAPTHDAKHAYGRIRSTAALASNPASANKPNDVEYDCEMQLDAMRNRPHAAHATYTPSAE